MIILHTSQILFVHFETTLQTTIQNQGTTTATTTTTDSIIIYKQPHTKEKSISLSITKPT